VWSEEYGGVRVMSGKSNELDAHVQAILQTVTWNHCCLQSLAAGKVRKIADYPG